MDATSSPDRTLSEHQPDDHCRRMLLRAPVLPHAAVVVASVWAGLHLPARAWDAIWPWTLVVLGLALTLAGKHGRRTRGWLVAAAGGAILVGMAARPPDLDVLRPSGPVEVDGVVASHPRGRAGERWLWLRARSIVQGDVRLAAELELLVALPAGKQVADDETLRPVWGQPVRLKGYLKRTQPLANGFEVRDGPWRLVVPSWHFWSPNGEPSRWRRWVGGIRSRVTTRLGCGEGNCGPGAELRQALVVGSPDGLPDRWRRALRATGTSHLLAVSGLHVGLVGGLLWLVALPLARRPRLLLSLAGIVVYVLLVGPKPSAVRAAGMAVLLLLATGVQRPPQALNAAALWAALLTLWEPQILDDLGFRLSVAATLGILTLGPPLEGLLASLRWRRQSPPRWLTGGLAVTLAAQLSTLPLLAPWTGLVHPLGWLLNLVAIPWLGMFLVLSFASLLPLAAGLDRVDGRLVAVLDLLALPLDALAGLPASPWLARLWLPGAGACWLIVAGAVLVLLASPRSVIFYLGPALWFAVLLPFLLPGLVPAMPATGSSTALEFHRLDVGQGDAFLLRHRSSENERAVLVDGGGWRRGDLAARVLVPALARRGIRRLDAVVLTHPDSDHCHGLRDLLAYVSIAEIWASPGWRDDCAGELLARSGPVWRPLWRGVDVWMGEWRFETLWPPPGQRRGEGNDRSLVLRVSGGRQTILLTGDIGSDVERRLATLEGTSLRADILAVPHHGSKSSTSDRFLRWVAPCLATIGVGARNPYGHPHATVLSRLTSAGIRIHRTDVQGALELRLRGDFPAGSRGDLPRGDRQCGDLQCGDLE